MKKYNRPTI